MTSTRKNRGKYCRLEGVWAKLQVSRNERQGKDFQGQQRVAELGWARGALHPEQKSGLGHFYSPNDPVPNSMNVWPLCAECMNKQLEG